MSLLNMLGRNPAAMDEMEKARQLGLQNQQQQQQPQQQGPSMWQRFNQPQNWAALSNAFNTLRFQPDQGLAASNQKIIDASMASKGANATIEWLRKKGRDDLADMVEKNPSIASSVLSAMLKGEQTSATAPSKVREYEYAKANGYEGSYQDFVQMGTTSAETFGTTPRTIITEDGGTRTVLLGNRGGIQDVDTGGGRMPVGAEKVDLGTHFQYFQGGVPVGAPIPKDVAGEREQAAIGTGMGEKAIEDLQGATRTIEVLSTQINKIDEVIDSPQLTEAVESRVGPVQGRMPALTSQQTLGESYIDQIAAQSFMRAFESLKGGGQITEKESAAAKASLDRLAKMTLSDEDYINALKQARDELATLVALNKRKLERSKNALGGNQGGITRRVVD
jgi:hypothetical protein